MAGESPENWVGKRVQVYIFNMAEPDVGKHSTTLLGINEMGVTVSGIPEGHTFFYPWNAIRQLELMPGQDDEEEAEESSTRVARAMSIRPRR